MAAWSRSRDVRRKLALVSPTRVGRLRAHVGCLFMRTSLSAQHTETVHHATVHTPVHRSREDFEASRLAATGSGNYQSCSLCTWCAQGLLPRVVQCVHGVAVSDLSEFLANAKGDRSIDAIADKATAAGHRIGRSVVAKYLRGEHGPRMPEATLTGLAAGFGVDVRELRRLAGRPPGELGPYVPIAEASSLTQPQRNALDQLMKAFVSEGDSHGLVGSAGKSTKAASVTPINHKRDRMSADALPAATAADDGSDSDEPDE